MSVLRSVLAVLVGYFVFALSAFAFFRLSGRPPHEPAPMPFMLASTAVGMLFASLGGFVAAWLAGRSPFAHGAAVAAVVALGAAISLVGTLGSGAIWSQVTALAFMAPCAVLGGWLRSRQRAGPSLAA